MVARVVGRRLQLWICERKRREEERKKKITFGSLFWCVGNNVTFGAHLCGVLDAMAVHAECVSEDANADECNAGR